MRSNVYEDIRFSKFLDSLKTQKFKYYENKNLFLLQVKESIHDTWDTGSDNMAKNSFLVKITLRKTSF